MDGTTYVNVIDARNGTDGVVSLASFLDVHRGIDVETCARALRDRGVYPLGDGRTLAAMCPVHGCSANECGADITACIAEDERDGEEEEDAYRAERAYERAHSAWAVSR